MGNTAGHIALTVAGSDSGGVAGIQADLKTFAALGVYRTSVITAITAQNLESIAGVLAVERYRHIPLVINPVLIATSGRTLLREDAITALTEQLFPMAALITPNIPKALFLAGGHSVYSL